MIDNLYQSYINKCIVLFGNAVIIMSNLEHIPEANKTLRKTDEYSGDDGYELLSKAIEKQRRLNDIYQEGLRILEDTRRIQNQCINTLADKNKNLEDIAEQERQIIEGSDKMLELYRRRADWMQERRLFRCSICDNMVQSLRKGEGEEESVKWTHKPTCSKWSQKT